MPDNQDDAETSDYTSTSLTQDEQDSLDRYSAKLRYHPITPRQWLEENTEIEPTNEFRKMLWSHFALQYPPPRLPGFEILDVLGEGGVGRVYLAQDQTLNRLVAIKELTEALRHSDANATRFRIEARVLAKLYHPNIVRIYQLISHDQREYIVMEYYSNGTLTERLKDDPVNKYKKLPRIMAQLARAIDHAHLKNIIHRDLKPSNILFDENNEPKLSDFGLAKDLSDLIDRTHGAVLGTHQYMSPEQVEGKIVGPGTDIWALGVILFRILTGQFPFDGQTVKELHTAIRRSKPKALPPEVPAELRRICLKCLETDADCRYQRGNELADDLEKAVGRPFLKIFSEFPSRRQFSVLGLCLVAAVVMALFALLRRATSESQEISITMREKLPGPTQSLAFTADGQFGLSEVAGSKLIVWDLKRGQMTRSVGHGLEQDGECGSVAPSPDGRYIMALGTSSALDKNGELSFLEIFNAETLNKSTDASFYGNKYGRSIAFSPDSKRLALESFETSALFSILLGSGRSRLSIYDLESRKWSKPIPLSARMTTSAFSPDGKLVLTGSVKPAICVWDLANPADSRQILVPIGGIDEVVFSQDGSRLFVASFANDLLSIYSSSGDCVKTIATTTKNAEKMTCASLNSSGNGVTGHRDGSVVYWDLKTGVSRSFQHKETEVSAVALSRDSRKALAAFSDGVVICYEIPALAK